MRNLNGLGDFFNGLLELENTEECYKIFKDLCTDRELETIGLRFEVARLLKRNLTYLEIQEELNVSTSTISRINKTLNEGEGGYNLFIDRINEKDRLKRV